MAKFGFEARLEYRGALILVEAKNKEEARNKAENMEWVDEDTTGAELVNWSIGKKVDVT